MAKFNVVFSEGGKAEIKELVEADDCDAAFNAFLRKHFGRKAFFQYDHSLSEGGSRLFGQVFKHVGRPGAYLYATSLTGRCYFDVDEVD